MERAVDCLHRSIAPIWPPRWVKMVVLGPLRIPIVEATSAVKRRAGEHREDSLWLVSDRRAGGGAIAVALPDELLVFRPVASPREVSCVNLLSAEQRLGAPVGEVDAAILMAARALHEGHTALDAQYHGWGILH
eukprot:gene12206-biopygen5625